MLDQNILEWWLDLALKFGNQPETTPEAEADKLLRLDLSPFEDETGERVVCLDMMDMEWMNNWDKVWIAPVGGYKKLRMDWRKCLSGEKNRLKFREWCKKNSTELKGEILFLYTSFMGEPVIWPK